MRIFEHYYVTMILGYLICTGLMILSVYAHPGIMMISIIAILIIVIALTKVTIHEFTTLRPKFVGTIRTKRKFKYYKRLLAKAYDDLSRKQGMYKDVNDEVYEYMLEVHIESYLKNTGQEI